VRHPLQAFSPAYFSGPDARLFSYSAENCQASQCGRAARVPPGAFLAPPLSEPEPDWRTIEVADLAEFFCNPGRWLVTRRLGLRFEEKDEALEEAEPFAVTPLDGYAIRQELVGLGLKRASGQDALQLLRAAGRLPLGEAGAACFHGLESEVQAFLEQLQPRLGAGYIDPLPVDHKLGEFRLTGEIRRLTANGSLHYRCASLKAKDLLRLWIPHVILNAAFPSGPHSDAVLVGSDKVLAFPPLAQAREILAGLLELYWKGLTAPLKFFPQTSWAYAEAVRAREAGESKRDPADVARLSWEGNPRGGVPGECEDAYFDLCFRSVDPLDEEFQQAALAVFAPLLGAVQEVAL